MKFDLLTRPLRGIITPLLTPFSADGAIDYFSLEKLVDHVIDGGVSGIFILGTTGEGPCLSLDQRCQIMLRIQGLVSGRVPVLVGVTDASVDTSVTLARYAEEAGVDGLVMTPPPYFTSSQDELFLHFEALSSVTRLPAYLYNIPSLTRTPIEPDTVDRLCDLPRFAGLKDSSGSMISFNMFMQVAKRKENFALYMGPEELLVESCLLGAHGGVHGGSNLFPELYVSLYEAAKERDFQRIEVLRDIVITISAQLYSLSENENHCIRVVKYLLSKWGICHETMVAPYRGLNADSKRKADVCFDPILSSLENAGIPNPNTRSRPEACNHS